MRRITFLSLLLLATLGYPVRELRANDACTVGCVGDMRSCLQTGSDVKLGCRTECKAEARHVGGCFRDCRVAFRAVRSSCRTDALACTSACGEPGDPGEPGEPGGPDPACPGKCGQALGQCLGGGPKTLPDCLQACPKGRDHHGCVEECLAAAKDRSSTCKADHDTCLAACGGVTTTTTTLPQPQCGDAVAPTCGGLCPEAALVCAEIEPGVCGCVGGSPSAAFVHP